jgi:hypothetical protein
MSKSLEEQLYSNAVEGNVADQITFVLSHPGTSQWLKRTLSEALSRDPVHTLNDLEILNLILRKRLEQLIANDRSQYQ